MSALPPIAALRAFEAAARHRSFKNAAAELGVTPTAISHQIRLLEQSLGEKLFIRAPRQVALTRAGEALFPPLRDAFAAMTRAVDGVRAKRGRREITLSAPSAFTALWLLPRLDGFVEANPDRSLRLHASDELVELHAGAADAAIRYGRAPFPGLLAEPLFEESFAATCSPRLGMREPADLLGQTLLHAEWRKTTERTPSWARWREAAALPALDTIAGPTFLDDSHLVQATIAGAGVALLSAVLVRDEISRGLLAQPFGPSLQGESYHLVHTGDPARADAVGRVKAWLLADLGDLSA